MCSYTWSNKSAKPDLNRLRTTAGVAQVELDPPIVTPNSDPERDEKWYGPLYSLTRSRLAIPESRGPHVAGTAVRVAVLDTAADKAGGGYTDPVGHGRAVARLIEEMACSGVAQCATQIVHVPAMPFLSNPTDQTLVPDPNSAGGVGTRGTLAAAIDKATNDWLAQPANTRPRNLVVNMSLGWSGCWEEQTVDPPNADTLWTAVMSLGSRAVLNSLTRAVCHGALVVAASGNAEAVEGCPTEPAAPGEPRHMYPGLWGGARVDATHCAEVGVAATFTGSRPLLVSVSAVDDLDLKSSIVDHESDLVAYGQALTVPDSTQSSGWTLPLSGTSMSAAAYSGMAAALWSASPGLTVQQLTAAGRDGAQVLRTAGPGEPGARDFVCNEYWNGGSCREVRRISLCGALAQIGASATCTTPFAGQATPAAFGTMNLMTGTADAIDCNDCGGPCPAECTSPVVAEYDGTDGPWVVPQPQPPGCGTCVLVPLLPIFQAEFLYSVGNLVLYVDRPLLGTSKIVLQTATVPGFTQKTWFLPLTALGGTSARLVYRAASSLAKESGDVVVSDIPPFVVP